MNTPVNVPKNVVVEVVASILLSRTEDPVAPSDVSQCFGDITEFDTSVGVYNMT